MSTHRRALHIRSEADDQAAEHPIATRRLLPAEWPGLADVVEDQAAVEPAARPARRPLGPGGASR